MKSILSILFLSLLIISCGKKDETANNTIQTQQQIEIINTWVRVSAQNMNTALFFEVKNKSLNPDTLYKVTSDAAEIIEIHETFHHENGMMGMRGIEFVEVPAKATVIFKPIDLHVMFINLNNDLMLGDSVQAELLFRKSGSVKISAEVKEMMKRE